MKKFDLESALKGEPVITKDGRPARIICTDAKGKYPIIALLSKKRDNGEIIEYVSCYTLEGNFQIGCNSELDLQMANVKKKSYTNIWEGENGKRYAEGVFSTRGEAEKQKILTLILNHNIVYITTIEIEWEE